MTENWAEKTSASGISISGNSPHLLHPHSLHYPNSQKRLCGGYRGMLWGGKLKKTLLCKQIPLAHFWTQPSVFWIFMNWKILTWKYFLILFYTYVKGGEGGTYICTIQLLRSISTASLKWIMMQMNASRKDVTQTMHKIDLGQTAELVEQFLEKLHPKQGASIRDNIAAASKRNHCQLRGFCLC